MIETWKQRVNVRQSLIFSIIAKKYMKKIKEILKFIDNRIQQIYERPLMYGGTASGVDLILHYYFELWAEVLEITEKFRKVSSQVYLEQDCGAADFSTKFRQNNPDAPEERVAVYVVEQWRRINERVNFRFEADTVSQE